LKYCLESFKEIVYINDKVHCRQDYQLYELAELAKLDNLVGGKKEEVTMESVMSNNEKIRDWVSLFYYKSSAEALILIL
jgi:hypothetical protein